MNLRLSSCIIVIFITASAAAQQASPHHERGPNGQPHMQTLSGGNLTTDTSSLFAGSGACIVCHFSNGRALTDGQGVDVSPPTDWRR
jgi:hypothetical protein